MSEYKQAIFAAGCFWSVEAAFRQVPGVLDVVSGYTGGTTENPTYRQVCTGATGHAESVRITYDPSKVSYESLLGVFWKIHDPTALNRQGPDHGTQYRSAIFVDGEEQRRTAQTSRDREQAKHSSPIVTQIADASAFYPAEEYHQRYFEKNGAACRVI
jgi:peptide-methionine (S)-S-oxide reductase